MNKISKLKKNLQSIGISNIRLIKLATDLEGKFAIGINYRAVSLALGFGTNPTKEQHPLIMDSINNDVHTFFTKDQVAKIKAYDFSIYSMNNFNVKNSLSKDERAFLAIVDVLGILKPRDMIRDYIVASDLKFNQLFKRMRNIGWIENDWLNINFYKSGVDALNKLQENYHNDDNEFKDQGSETDRFIDLNNVVYEKDGYQIVYIKSVEDDAPLYNNIPETSNDRVVLGNKLHICLGAKSKLYQNNNDGPVYGIFETGSSEPLAALRISGNRLEEARCKYNKNLSENLYSIVINYLNDKVNEDITIDDDSGFKLDIDLIYSLKNSIDKEKAISLLKKNQLYSETDKIVLDKMIEMGIDESKDKQIIIKTDESIKYYKNLKLHREDGPAIEWSNGDKEWYINGQLHRVDGPAIEWFDGTKEWYLKDKRHRIDGPAIEWSDGTKEWYIKGRLHRLDGPAREWINESKEWWINETEYAKEKFDKIISNYYKDIDIDKPSEIDAYGNKYWKNDEGEYHRVNGPAIKYVFGDKIWYLNGLIHREDGPAIEYASGNKQWCLNGKLHREDGPAIERADGSKEWFINGKLHRIDGPAIESIYGHKKWFINGVEYTEKQFDKIIKEKY